MEKNKERAVGREFALELYQEPVLIVDVERRVLFRNAVAARVLRGKSGFAERAGRLVLDSARADMSVETIMSAFRGAADLVSARAVRVPRGGNCDEWVMLLHPLLEVDREPSGPLVLVQLIGRKQPRHTSPAVLRDLFGLTPREIQVVAALFRVRTVKGVSARMGLSIETIRSHVKRIFRKCDVHSKAEFASLLHCISTFG